jgi:hypothetical protein
MPDAITNLVVASGTVLCYNVLMEVSYAELLSAL